MVKSIEEMFPDWKEIEPWLDYESRKFDSSIWEDERVKDCSFHSKNQLPMSDECPICENWTNLGYKYQAALRKAMYDAMYEVAEPTTEDFLTLLEKRKGGSK